MSQTWITSDSHLNHNKSFIWEARGFKNIEEMNEAIIERWNSLVQPDDIVYHLGDIMLGDLSAGLALVTQLHGHIFLVIGNHDTQNRIDYLAHMHNIDDIKFGYRLKSGHHTLLLTHYPTITANGNDTSVWNLYGHTHQKTNFYEDRYYMYHVGVDSHNCYPILLDDALADIRQKRDEVRNKNNEK